MQSPMQSHDSVWEAAVAFTRERSPASFDQWFSGIQYDGFTDGVLSLSARDEFVREWVDDHFWPTLKRYMEEQTGLSVQVAWSIDSGIRSPVVDQPMHAPVRSRPLTLRPSQPPPPPSSEPAAGDLADSGPSLSALPEMAPSSLQNIVAADAYPIEAASGIMQAVAPPIDGLNPKYTFGNFVVGPSNQLAHAASIAAAGGGGRRHNPALHLRRHRPRQDAPRPRHRPPRARGAPGRAHRLRVAPSASSTSSSRRSRTSG